MNKILRYFLIRLLVFTPKCWPDRFYLKSLYYVDNGKHLNLDNPTTFNEKLNWMKFHDQNPLYRTLVDKYKVKKIVEEKIGSEYVVKNYAVYNSVDEIDLDSLPDSFVLKATHDSGGVIICKSKSSFDLQAAKKKLKRQLSIDYYWKTREWVYKDPDPKIIADEYLDDHSGHELTDYKFWCFNGEPKVMYITNKGKNIKENFYDMDFAPLDINHGFPRVVPEFEKPEQFELMKELAKKLSQGIPFVREDFFNLNGRVYFGEFTFYDWAGLKAFVDDEWDRKLGSWINLPK